MKAGLREPAGDRCVPAIGWIILVVDPARPERALIRSLYPD